MDQQEWLKQRIHYIETVLIPMMVGLLKKIQHELSEWREKML